MLLAGWSSRVSSIGISDYEKVVTRLRDLGWDHLVQLDPAAVADIAEPLGLGASRLRYFHSLIGFLGTSDTASKLLCKPNNLLIEEFRSRVAGAGYKIAQRALLYARGYHCGIIPVDSSKADMLAPLIEPGLPSGPHRQEVVRRLVEHAVVERSDELHEIAESTGITLGIDRSVPPTWWVYLLLVACRRPLWRRSRTTDARDRFVGGTT